MKKILFSLYFSLTAFFVLTSSVQAVTPVPLATDSAQDVLVIDSTVSAEPATPSSVIQKLQEKKDEDITETTGTKKDKLAAYLDENPIGSLSWHNFLQHAIRRSIDRGLPSNIVVLILLFPVIASIIAFSRHIIGLKGFGIYTPAVLSVAFVSTGIVKGIVLFGVVLMAAMFMRRALRQINMQYLPRTAMLLWGVSIFTLLFLITLALLPASIALTVNIFPLLIIILLTENFMESQLAGNQSEAIQLTIETLLTAVVCSLFIGAEPIQKYVMLQPELTLSLVAIFNILIGRYVGLRLLEWIRFRSIID